jgi:lipid-binding SYLF domain-containing protein
MRKHADKRETLLQEETKAMKKLIAAFALTTAILSGAESDAPARLQAATDVLKEVMGIPDKAIPQELLNKAQCIVIIPGLKKGAFIVGAKYGKGFVSCRAKSGVGWGAPGSVRVEGGSFGLQAGGSETDVIMVVRNESGMNRLLSTKFTLGGDVTVAAGPVGRSTQAETDAAMTAEILTWSRARGLFAGVSLSGATLRDLYGRKITNREIVTSTIAPPAPAKPLLDELNRYSSRK